MAIPPGAPWIADTSRASSRAARCEDVAVSGGSGADFDVGDDGADEQPEITLAAPKSAATSAETRVIDHGVTFTGRQPRPDRRKAFKGAPQYFAIGARSGNDPVMASGGGALRSKDLVPSARVNTGR
jgi:hypothetical protein